MVYEQERVFRLCDGFLCSMSAICDGAELLLLVLPLQYCNGSTNKLFCMCFLHYQEANEVFLSVWLCWMHLKGT